MSADSIVPDWYDPQSLNRYAYCRNNPLKYQDPDGHEPVYEVPPTPTLFDPSGFLRDFIDYGKRLHTGLDNTTDSKSEQVKRAVEEGLKIGADLDSTFGSGDSKKVGRQGKQAKLKEIADDPNTSSADRGWIKQEADSIKRKSTNEAGNPRKNIRNPPGKDLAHDRGREAAKGFGYSDSKLKNKVDHKLQHKYDNHGRKNKPRPKRKKRD